MSRITNIQVRRGLDTDWTTQVLSDGEIGFETNTGKFKIGSGGVAWNLLEYATDTSNFVGLLSGTNGGTGVNNGTKTITVGGNLTTSGTTTIGSSTNTVSLATAGNTSVTLPTTGTLLSTANVVTIAQGGTNASNLDVARSNLGIGSQYLPFVSGAYYRSAVQISVTAAATFAQNTLYLTPFYVGAPTTFSTIGLTSATITATGNVRLGIYNDGGGSCGSLVFDSGAVNIASTSVINTVQSATCGQTLPAGWYWLGAVLQGATGSFYGTAATSTIGGQQRMVAQPSSGTVMSNQQQTSVSGALPNPPASPSNNSTAAITCWLQAA